MTRTSLIISGFLIIFVAFSSVADVIAHDIGFGGLTVDRVADVLADSQLYCAHARTEAEQAALLKARKIPILETTIAGPQLKQVQTLIRHGARTSAAIRKCWPGYQQTWECQNSEVTGGIHEGQPSFTFAKRFNARLDANPLPGDCELGQLIDEGHQQHEVTGKVLANAYFTQTKLFDMEKALNDGTLADSIYFRSTEYQRTRLSGAALLTSMIKTIVPTASNPNLPLHTVEKSKDTLFPNEDVCYDLKLIEEEAFASQAYREKFENAHYDIKKRAEELLDLPSHPADWPTGVLDCLYTTMCPGKDLPAKWDKNEIAEILKAVHEEAQWYYRYDGAKYSKLALARLTYEIKQFILKMFPNELSSKSMVTPDKAVPFVLWSAHDSTVSPYLATFGDAMSAAMGQAGAGDFSFPPYASLLTIESYSTTNKGPHVRLVYNSKVMTQHVKGCPTNEQLCPMPVFLEAMSWATKEFAEAPCEHKKPICTVTEENSAAFTWSTFSSLIIVSLIGLFSLSSH